MISARLQEFFKLLQSFVKVCNLMEKIRSADMPAMLKEICHPVGQGGRFPAGIREVCKDFLEVGEQFYLGNNFVEGEWGMIILLKGKGK